MSDCLSLQCFNVQLSALKETASHTNVEKEKKKTPLPHDLKMGKPSMDMIPFIHAKKHKSVRPLL
jgi:hypothetical protein